MVHHGSRIMPSLNHQGCNRKKSIVKQHEMSSLFFSNFKQNLSVLLLVFHISLYTQINAKSPSFSSKVVCVEKKFLF